MSEQDRIAFEAWYDNDISEPLPDDYTILGKRYLYMGWKAATTEANKRIAELDGEVAELKGEKVRHDQLVDYLKAGIAEELEQTILELQASNNDLREALEGLLKYFTRIPSTLKDTEARIKAHKALSTTPAESLQAHDAETIKRYADDLDNNHWVFIPHDLRKPLKEGK